MAEPFSLIPELEEVVRGSSERRSNALRRVTTLFLQGAGRFSSDHVCLFDDVFVTLLSEIEINPRAELSRRLASVANAPVNAIRRLANDDEIVVAGPVLAQSPVLVTADLIEIANTKSVDHLYAISTRSTIDEQVTDILVFRGDFKVKRKLAGNAGARISRDSFSALIRSAEHDSVLAETVVLRTDIPNHLFRELLAGATDVVQRRLLENARPETQAHIRQLLCMVTGEDTGKPVRDFSDARQRMQALAKAGRLGEAELAVFAKTRAYDNMIAAIAELTGVPTDVVVRLVEAERPDPILILCKAAGYSWSTTRDIIRARRGAIGKAPPTVDAVSASFDKLSLPTARRVVRFWQVSPASLATAV